MSRLKKFTALLLLQTSTACSGGNHAGLSEPDNGEGHHDDGRPSTPVTVPNASASVGATQIVDLLGFSEVAFGDDAFADRPSVAITCQGWVLEGTYVEVNTGACPYVTLSSPTLRDLPAGATLGATFWHTALTAPVSGAEAHIEVSVGGETLLSEQISIPRAAEVYNRDLTLTHAIPAQTPLFIHVHNHGANSYRFTPPWVK